MGWFNLLLLVQNFERFFPYLVVSGEMLNGIAVDPHPFDSHLSSCLIFHLVCMQIYSGPSILRFQLYLKQNHFDFAQFGAHLLLPDPPHRHQVSRMLALQVADSAAAGAAPGGTVTHSHGSLFCGGQPSF